MRRTFTLLTMGALALSTLALATTPANGALAKPAVLRTTLSGAAELPGPGDVDGTGRALVVVNPTIDTICYFVKAKSIILPALAAHIHVGAADVAGPILVNLNAPNAIGLSGSCTSSPEADAIAANPSNYYVNVHTTDFPAGAVRGQL